MQFQRVIVPNPLPLPLPGSGIEGSYQWLFDKRYYQTRIDALKPFAYGLAAGEFPSFPNGQADKLNQLADKLYDWVAPGGPGIYGPGHVDFDQEIDFWRWAAYSTMFQRTQVYGYQRVPIGTGTTMQPPNVVNTEDLQGPPVTGQYLLSTCDINLL